MYRNDICCRRKFAYDMEGAAAKWGSHNAEILYLCTACGFIHFSGSNTPVRERIYERAWRQYEAWAGIQSVAIPQANPKKMKPKKAKIMRFRHVTNWAEVQGKGWLEGGTCKTAVWKASGESIGELLRLKGVSF